MKQYDKDQAILQHIINYCEEIENTVTRFGDDFEIFSQDSAYRNACALCILQIGELCNLLTPTFRKQYSDMPWNQIRGMRNVVAHAYGSISIQTTWDTLKTDIPMLKAFCEKVLADNWA